jgi:hypothetical protein
MMCKCILIPYTALYIIQVHFRINHVTVMVIYVCSFMAVKSYTFLHCRFAVSFYRCSAPDNSEGSKQCTIGQIGLRWQKS